MLEIVQHEQACPIVQILLHRVLGGEVDIKWDADNAGDCSGSSSRVANGGERYEPDFVTPGMDLFRDLEGQARLAYTAGAGEGDEPHILALHPGNEVSNIILTPDKAGGWGRESVAWLPAAQGRVPEKWR
jgi:hypothetical protein